MLRYALIGDISELRRSQNFLARIVTCSSGRNSARLSLERLYWLSVSKQIKVKIALFNFKTQSISVQQYPNTLAKFSNVGRILLSSATPKLLSRGIFCLEQLF